MCSPRQSWAWVRARAPAARPLVVSELLLVPAASHVCFLPRFYYKHFLFPHKADSTKVFFKRKLLRLYSRYIPSRTKQQNINQPWESWGFTPLDAQSGLLFYYRAFSRVYRTNGGGRTVTGRHGGCVSGARPSLVQTLHEGKNEGGADAVTWTSTVTTNTDSLCGEHTLRSSETSRLFTDQVFDGN